MENSRTPLLRAVNGKKDTSGRDDGKLNELIERKFLAADRALKEGDSDRAAMMLDSLLKQHPTHYRSLMLQSAIAMARHQYAKAEMYTRAAIKTLPPASVVSLDRAVALSQLADALTRQGKGKEAQVFIRMLGDAAQTHADGAKARVTSEERKTKEDVFTGAQQNMSKEAEAMVTRTAANADKEAEQMLEESADVKSLRKPTVVGRRTGNDISAMAHGNLWSHDELYERKVVFVGMRQREVLNAFREVRIRLLQAQRGDNMVIMVSSLKAGGGSSFFSFNLAATFALDPQKTALFVDCNPYDSSAERYVTGGVDRGLTQYLQEDQMQLQDIIYPSGVQRLRVIPSAGNTEAAAEFFNSERMRKFIEEVKARYPDRFIVLDAPSVQTSTEARILAQYVDQVLLLVPFGRATNDEVLSGIDAVGKNKFAGLVFNH